MTKTRRIRGASIAAALIFSMVVTGSDAWAVVGVTRLISKNSSNQSANGPSYRADISADGIVIAYSSYASDLVPGDPFPGDSDVYIYDQRVGTTERVSIDSSGTPADGPSFHPSISSDGSRVAFESQASNLVPGDTNGVSDIFVHDRAFAVTVRVSVDSSGHEGNSESRSPVISADGKHIAFLSKATNLAAAGAPGIWQVYVHTLNDDLSTGTTNLVSRNPACQAGNRSSASLNAQGEPLYAPGISADGRFVVFSSEATNLVPRDLNQERDVFRYDRDVSQDGTLDECDPSPSGKVDVSIRRISVSPSGADADRASDAPSISSDGSFVVFQSAATNLAFRDPLNLIPYEIASGHTQIFRRDIARSVTDLMSLDQLGDASHGQSMDPVITADGTRVVFSSSATDLVLDDTNGSFPDVFSRDVTLGRTELVSVDHQGNQGLGESGSAAISQDGFLTVFQSEVDTLASGEGVNDDNGVMDIFLRDTGRCDTGQAEDGPASQIIHEIVEPATGDAGPILHNANCSLVRPTEQLLLDR